MFTDHVLELLIAEPNKLNRAIDALQEDNDRDSSSVEKARDAKGKCGRSGRVPEETSFERRRQAKNGAWAEEAVGGSQGSNASALRIRTGDDEESKHGSSSQAGRCQEELG